MDWQQARERTFEKWRRIRDGIGTGDPVELLAELNAVCDLCEKAREVAGRDGERCAHCVVFGTPESCKDARFEVGEALLDCDLEQARSLVEEVIERVRSAELPAGDDRRVGA